MCARAPVHACVRACKVAQGPGAEGGERTTERAIGYRQVLDLLWKWKETVQAAPESVTSEMQVSASEMGG